MFITKWVWFNITSLFDPQANHGGISLVLPRSLQDIFEEEAEEEEEEDGEDTKEEEGGGAENGVPMDEGQQNGTGPLDETWGDISFNTDKGMDDGCQSNGQQKQQQQRELQMNWHICKHLPEEGSCQSFFQVSHVLHVPSSLLWDGGAVLYLVG